MPMEFNQETPAQCHNIDARISQQFDAAKRCESTEIKLRQQLRETEPELRDLERKLRQAYVAKELTCQIAQKKADRLEEKLREQQANDVFYNQLRIDESKYEDSFEIANMQKKIEYREALQKQILEKQNQAKIQYENFVREKKLLDEIARRVHDEEERIILLKMEKMKKTQQEIQIFLQAREQWRKYEVQRIKEENERIEKYLNNQMIEQQKRAVQKQMKTDAKERIISQLGEKIIARERMLQEREQVLKEIEEVQYQEQGNYRKQLEMEKKFRDRLAMTATLNQQMQEREERLKREKLEESKYREEFMQRMIEEQKIEQMSEQKRRMRMLEIRRATEAVMMERQQHRLEEIEKLWRDRELQQEEDVARRQRVETERIRLLKEHFENLIGFLPAGVLRPEDLKYLNEKA